MTRFYNPYQFIPVTGKPTATTDWPHSKPLTESAAARTLRQDLWLAGRLSGRLVCRVHLESPTFVGAEHHKDETNPTPIDAYKRDGEPAIPGNSLRGMIGSMAEALSQSALRVLEDRRYSIRKPVPPRNGLGPLSALGRIRREGDACFLEPLTLPTIVAAQGQPFAVTSKWQRVFPDAKWGEVLGAYVDGYCPDKPKKPEKLVYVTDTFLADQNPASALALHPEDLWYAMSTAPLGDPITQELPAGATGLKIKQTEKLTFLLGQTLAGAPDRENGGDKMPGILRVLGIEGRESVLPLRQKKHEIFIPRRTGPFPNIRIPEPVLERFSRLIAERMDERTGLPFFPKGYENLRPDPKALEKVPASWRPEPGMLVYFDVQPVDQGIEVSEIAFSAIWRAEVDATAHDFFASIDKGILPWSPDRAALTPAEALFGVVESGRPDEGRARNLASRLRFSDALPGEVPVRLVTLTNDEERRGGQKLKILASPKPPSPAMYFHPDGKPGVYVSKPQLKQTPGRYRPNGRKYYLPHREFTDRSWVSGNRDHDNQKVICRPMEAGQDFWFHIDFDNLGDDELALLRTALSPGKGFRHRLGLGKPLGLGSVTVQIEGQFLVDRLARYGTDAGGGARYSGAQSFTDSPANAGDWPEQYALEREILDRLTQAGAVPAVAGNNAEPGEIGESLVDDHTLRIVRMLGKPERQQAGLQVHTPLRNWQNNTERETFKWFGQNDRSQAQALPAIDPEDEHMKPLRRN